MQFRFIIEASAERTEGKFAGREEIEQLFISDLENAQPDLSGLENGGSYEVSDFNVSADDPDNMSVNKFQWAHMIAVCREALALHNAAVHHPKLQILTPQIQKVFARHLAKINGLGASLATRAYVDRAGERRANNWRRRVLNRFPDLERRAPEHPDHIGRRIALKDRRGA